MVTPEMLLFLARKMDIPVDAHPMTHGVVWIKPYPPLSEPFNPATNDAQFGRLVVWAAQNDCVTAVYPQEAAAWLYENNPSGGSHSVRHDSTPDSIRAAAVVAVCRALGWEGT